MYYTVFKCGKCKKDHIVITEDIKGTLSCPHCGSKKLKKTKSHDDLRQVIYAVTHKKTLLERGR